MTGALEELNEVEAFDLETLAFEEPRVAIDVRGLRKTYGALEAVKGVSLEIKAGEVFGLIGPDGAGKTSVFQILGGVMTQTAGTAEMYGVTARDAQRITSGLVKRGQRQTSDVLKDLENLLDTSKARGRAVRRASPVLAQADRLRRTAGVGPSFPITGYDDLTASQVQGRLGTLTPAELRKVRDYERRNAKRKTVLSSIESKLT